MNKSKEKILHAAFRCFVEKGFAGTSLREIARYSDKPVSHVRYYFKGIDDIFNESFGLMVADGLQIMERYLADCKRDDERLIAYLEAMLDWVGQNRHYQILWMMFSHQIIHDPNAKIFFQETLRTGQERIVELLVPICKKANQEEINQLAFDIQTLIIGTLYRISTFERYGPQTRNQLIKSVFKMVASF